MTTSSRKPIIVSRIDDFIYFSGCHARSVDMHIGDKFARMIIINDRGFNCRLDSSDLNLAEFFQLVVDGACFAVTVDHLAEFHEYAKFIRESAPLYLEDLEAQSKRCLDHLSLNLPDKLFFVL
jgi:hypothetical protein